MNTGDDAPSSGRYIDLHIHSTFSDGLFSPQKIMEIARERHLKAVSITDHDTVAALHSAAEIGRSYGIEVISGIEIGVAYHNCEVHLLGYFIDDQSRPIKQYAQMLMGSREERARKIVTVLQNQGLHISFEQVALKANGAPIGRPHIAEVLIEEGHVFSFYEAFQKYLGEGKSADVPKQTIEPQKAIDMVKEAGGLVFIAHPATIDCFEEAFKALLSYGLDGLETIHPQHNAEMRKYFHDMAKRNGLLQSGGSDCHGGRDGNVMLGTLPVPVHFLQRMKERLNGRRRA